MKYIFIGFVKIYQITLSPFIGQQCRFTPTCSYYAINSLKQHGALVGSVLTIKRLLRCHPWQTGGHDPLP